MKVNQIRLSFLSILLPVLGMSQLVIVIYLLVMWASVELLNSFKTYRQEQSNENLNFVFWIYTLFVVVARTRRHHFDSFFEEAINISEHFFYAIVIGIKLASYVKILCKTISIWNLVGIAFLLNIIGFFNEIFQNWVCKRPLHLFTQDSQKDMLVNLIGSLVFTTGMLYYQYRIRKKVVAQS